MESASEQPDPSLARRITRCVIMELKRFDSCAHSFRVRMRATLEGVHPTSERAIFDHYGCVAVEGQAVSVHGRAIYMVGHYDVAAGIVQQVEIS